MYYITGGMPESVLMWTQERDIEAMQAALINIICAYERDFAKHPDVKEFPKISMIWKSISSQLARENKKFIYKVVKDGARAREYKDALQWLVDANLVKKIYCSTAPGLPLSAYDDWSQINPSYEVDFIIQRENNIIPVEVKSEATTETKSLKKYKEKFGDSVKLRVRFSLDNLKLDDDLLNIPLFMADQANRLIGLALNNKE